MNTISTAYRLANILVSIFRHINIIEDTRSMRFSEPDRIDDDGTAVFYFHDDERKFEFTVREIE